METLLQKAITAIKDEKSDYAIGLLEGVIAMLPASKPVSPPTARLEPVSMPAMDEGDALDQQVLTKINNLQGFAYEQEN